MMAGKNAPRVVITGVGVISPVGIGKDRFWENLIAGNSGIGYLQSVPNQSLPSKLAAEIRDFNPADYVYQKKFLKVMSRDIQLGVCAASMAMKDAGISTGDVDPDRLGVEFGAGHISFTPEELAEAAPLGRQPRLRQRNRLEARRRGVELVGVVLEVALALRVGQRPVGIRLRHPVDDRIPVLDFRLFGPVHLGLLQAVFRDRPDTEGEAEKNREPDIPDHDAFQFVAGAGVVAAASTWSSASTTASKVSMVEAWRAL